MMTSTVLAELPELGKLNRGEIAKLASLAIFHVTSSSSRDHRVHVRVCRDPNLVKNINRRISGLYVKLSFLVETGIPFLLFSGKSHGRESRTAQGKIRTSF